MNTVQKVWDQLKWPQHIEQFCHILQGTKKWTWQLVSFSHLQCTFWRLSLQRNCRNFPEVHLVCPKSAPGVSKKCSCCAQKVHLGCSKSAQNVHSIVHSIVIKCEHEQHTHCLHIPALVRASNTVTPPPPPPSYNSVKHCQALPLRSGHTQKILWKPGEGKEENCLST